MRWLRPCVVDDGFGPEQAQDVDLLGDAAAARVEVFAESLVLKGVPADGDAETQAPGREDVYLRGLLGDEGRLALGQDDDAADELDLAGEGAEVGEEDERLVKAALVGVTASGAGWAVRRVGAEHVVVGEEVGKAEAFGGLGEVAQDGGVVADFGLGEGDADFQGELLSRFRRSVATSPRCRAPSPHCGEGCGRWGEGT